MLDDLVQEQTRIAAVEEGADHLDARISALEKRVNDEDIERSDSDDRQARLLARVAQLENGLARLKAEAATVSDAFPSATPKATPTSKAAVILAGDSMLVIALPGFRTASSSGSPTPLPQAITIPSAPSSSSSPSLTSPNARMTGHHSPRHANAPRTDSASRDRQLDRYDTDSPQGVASVSPVSSPSPLRPDPSFASIYHRPRALSTSDICTLGPFLPFDAARRESQYLSEAEITVLEHKMEHLRRRRATSASGSAGLTQLRRRGSGVGTGRIRKIANGRIEKVNKAVSKAGGRVGLTSRHALRKIKNAVVMGARQIWRRKAWVAGGVGVISAGSVTLTCWEQVCTAR